jgi:hypothetical protein
MDALAKGLRSKKIVLNNAGEKASPSQRNAIKKDRIGVNIFTHAKKYQR